MMPKGIFPRPSIRERFWKQIDKSKGPSACWPWTGGCYKRKGPARGYIRWNYRMMFSSRVAYILKRGKIPKNIKVCHKCDNPICCNPKHLFLGTTKDNSDDMVAKGRQTKGDQCRTAKLNVNKVRRARRLFETGKLRLTDLAKKYNVTKTTMRFAFNRWTWRHI